MKISVLIPVFNSKDRLSICLESVLSQTYNDLEIIVVNDGSTDGSDKIIREYGEKDNRIRSYIQHNKGIGATRNRLVDLMTGDYALFVDSDDRLTKDACEKLSRIVLEHKCDLVVFDYYREYRDKEFNRDKLMHDTPIIRECSNDEAIRKYVSNNHEFSMHLWRRLYSRRLLKSVRFDKELLPEDYYTAFDYYKKADAIVYTNLQLYGYYVSCDGLTCRKGLKYEKQGLNVGRTVYEKERKYFDGDEKSIKRITTIYCNSILTIYAKLLLSKDYSSDYDAVIKECGERLSSLSLKHLELKTKIAYALFRIMPKISSKIISKNSQRKQEKR